MPVKTKYRDPKTTDFSKEDIVLNAKSGTLFYKSERGLHKIDDSPPPNYIFQPFGADWGSSTAQEHIDWPNQFAVGEMYIKGFAGASHSGNTHTLSYPGNVYPTRMLLMPFDGFIHKLFFKQTGTTPQTTIRLYLNSNNIMSGIGAITAYGSLAKEVVNNNNIGTGEGANVGDINIIDFNIKVKAGDHIMVSLQASQDGIHEIMGQLLYSQEITI